MGTKEEKKEKKKKALLDSAYELFTTIGYHKTTILFIATRAGVAKGTFYLYFKDKEDIRDALIVKKSSELLREALDELNSELQAHPQPMASADKLIFITDYIITRLSRNLALLRFIAKNLTWGLFINAGKYRAGDSEILDFHEFIAHMLQDDGIALTRDLELSIFTIIELVSSTCYSVILEGEPVTLSEYKPFLYDTIRLIFDAKTKPAGQGRSPSIA